jgi:hypothetical protein
MPVMDGWGLLDRDNYGILSVDEGDKDKYSYSKIIRFSKTI